MRTLIIAEAGVNHNGDMELAGRLVDVAAGAGVDIVKFQTFRAESLVTPYAEKAEYQVTGTPEGESQLEMLSALELSLEAHGTLRDRCLAHGVEFLSTGFDRDSVDLLAGLGVDRFKIPSGEITDLPYLRHVGAYGKPVILSTGMATLEEVEEALDALERAGSPRDRITVLHCTSAYPTPADEVNLRAMLTIRDAFGVEVGFSDHTLGIEVAVAAVALGARVIEKHFTLDRSLPGPDHQASLEPDELSDLVRAIRNVEAAMGDGVKRPTPSEASNMTLVRKSIVAATDIRAGDVYDDVNLCVKRPGTGLSPMRWDELLGRRAARDYQPDELIEW